MIIGTATASQTQNDQMLCKNSSKLTVVRAPRHGCHLVDHHDAEIVTRIETEEVGTVHTGLVAIIAEVAVAVAVAVAVPRGMETHATLIV
jgi:hypothetical protein